MKLTRSLFAAAALSLATGALPLAATPAHAQINNQDPGRFVQGLGTTGLSALRGNRNAARGKFRALLAQHFAVDAIGDRLIQRWRRQITPAQYAQYKAAFPGFIIGSYADRLYDYSNATLKVGQVQNRGASAAVATTVTKPGARPVQVIWTLARVGNGYKVSNLTVNGVNVAMAQQADFNSYIQRNGFNSLIAFMKRRG
jgi:phospholipid transport system substrate-binding protein